MANLQWIDYGVDCLIKAHTIKVIVYFDAYVLANHLCMTAQQYFFPFPLLCLSCQGPSMLTSHWCF